MKWKHHSILAASVASLLGFSLVEVVYCACLANLPDQMEKIGPVRVSQHRNWSHDLGLWGGASACLFFLGTSHALFEHIGMRSWIVPLPGVMHLFGDVLTPCGIRFFTKKIRVPVFKTGSLGEWIFVAFVGVAALLAFFSGHSYH